MSEKKESESVVAARRKFLASCGKFAVVTPPAVTLLRSSAHQNFAVASSGGLHHPSRGSSTLHADNGFGNGGGDGVPGGSGHSDVNR